MVILRDYEDKLQVSGISGRVGGLCTVNVAVGLPIKGY